MRRVLLMQLDGSLPNLALMRIAGHHLRRGDPVELRQVRTAEAAARRLWDSGEETVYASLIFERSAPLARAVLRAWPGATVGGTGWSLGATLEAIGVDGPPDYSVYGGFRQSIGFTQRGCRLECPFCVVPRKEGNVRPAGTVYDVWRGDPWPRELILLDNDFFGQPGWRDRIKEMRDGKFKVNFNQGINARLLPDEGAEAIASLDYRNAAMKTRAIYTAWDNRDDEAVLFRGLRRLTKYGVKPDDITVYLLVGYWAGETEADWLYRAKRLRDFGARPYPMPYRREGLAKAFQTWCVGAYDKRVSWEDWKAARGNPRRLGRSSGFPLRLFDDAHAERSQP